MCDRISASSIRMEIEEQIAREALHIYRMVIDTVKDPQAAVRLVNGVMVGTDYVMQYKATQFSDTLPEFRTADKIAPAPAVVPTTPAAPPAPEAPKAETPRPPPAEQKLTTVKCSICATDCERKISDRTGKPFYRCPKCKDNRQRNGTPFPEREG